MFFILCNKLHVVLLSNPNAYPSIATASSSIAILYANSSSSRRCNFPSHCDGSSLHKQSYSSHWVHQERSPICRSDVPCRKLQMWFCIDSGSSLTRTENKRHRATAN
mmetsp:Transcript_3089/g.5766  ORF Transcript_3089/g.5766 Transcript_3089/m.5766 type:complete len:107 (+) Transcript_3089:56-376(+)